MEHLRFASSAAQRVAIQRSGRRETGSRPATILSTGPVRCSGWLGRNAALALKTHRQRAEARCLKGSLGLGVEGPAGELHVANTLPASSGKHPFNQGASYPQLPISWRDPDIFQLIESLRTADRAGRPLANHGNRISCRDFADAGDPNASVRLTQPGSKQLRHGPRLRMPEKRRRRRKVQVVNDAVHLDQEVDVPLLCFTDGDSHPRCHRPNVMPLSGRGGARATLDRK